jgi:hypothetical protein
MVWHFYHFLFHLQSSLPTLQIFLHLIVPISIDVPDSRSAKRVRVNDEESEEPGLAVNHSCPCLQF